MVILSIVSLLPFCYGTAYLVHCIKKRRLAAAFGMLLLLSVLVLLTAMLLRYRVRS